MSKVTLTSNTLLPFRNQIKSVSRVALAFYLLSPNVLLADALINAASNNGPEIVTSANGTTVVNINKATAGGVSRNDYNDFNVSEKGLILNNSANIVNTTIAGHIDGNARLQGKSASIILNEVLGGSASNLQGYTEVAGQAAEVIIANQSGITCNGCGFINTTRGVLTTGQLQFEGGDFSGYNVAQGQISIEGEGLNAANIDQVDLLARSISLNGKVWADKLNAITGQNTIAHDNLEILTSKDSGNNQPDFSLDVSALGGMYANRIRLIGTENGLGVNSAGDLVAINKLQIDQSGKITNSGTIATSDLEINSTELTNNQSAVISAAQSQFDIENDLKNEGTIKGEDLNINTKDLLNANGGAISSTDSIAINAINSVDNSNATIEANGDISITTENFNNSNEAVVMSNSGVFSVESNSFDNQALIESDTISINTQNFNNQGVDTKLQATTDISINATTDINNTQGALIYSAGDTVLETQANLENNNSIIASGGSFDFIGQAFNNYSESPDSNFAALQVTGNATLTTNQINNSAGSVLATENGLLDINNTGSINNTGLIAGAQVDITTDAILNSGSDAQIQAKESLSIDAIQTWYNQMGALIFSEGLASLTTQGDFYNNSGVVETLGNLNIDAQRIYNQKLASHDEKSYLVSSADMNLTGSVYNKEAAIQTTGNFNQEQGLFHNYSTGVLKAVDGEAKFDSTNWYNYGFIGGNSVNVTAQTIDNYGDQALVLAHDQLAMTTTQGDLRNRNGGVLYSFGEADFNVKNTLLNEASYIESMSDMGIVSKNIVNKRDTFKTSYDVFVSDSANEKSIEKHELLNPPSKKLWYANITYTEVTRDPKVIDNGTQGEIISGGNLSLNASNLLHNKYSLISSSNNMHIQAKTLNNENMEEEFTKTWTGTYKWGTWKKCKSYETCGHKDRRHYTDDFTKIIEKKNVVLASAILSSGGTISGSVNNMTNGDLRNLDANTTVPVGDRRNQEAEVSAPSSQAVDGSVDIISSDIIDNGSNLDDLSNGALFSQVDNGDHGYLIETNPNFTEYENFISSDYMLEKMGVDINESDNVRLGDGYFEQDLVRDQILDLTGTQYIQDNQNLQDQYLALMNSGLEAKDDLSLSIGIALTAEQIQALDKPIVWMVEKQFETQNGTKTALVPQVYFSDTMGLTLREDGALIAGDSVDLEATNDIANAGVIKAKDKLKLVANDIKNTNKLASTNELELTAHRDINNASGLIESARVNINAGRDFINETQVDVLDLSSGNSSFKQSLVGNTATINAQDLNITAGNDVKLIGSNLNVEGDLIVEAVNNIEMTTAKIIEEAVSGNFYNVSSVEHQSTQIGAGTVLMIAGGTVKAEGAKVNAQDSLEIDANDIQLLAVKNTEDKDVYYNYGGGDTEHTQSHSEDVVASAFNTTGVLTISSKNDIISKGTQFQGGEGVALSAQGNVLLATETALNTSRVDTTSKSSGLGGSTRRASTEINESLTHTGSSIQSDGSVTIQSGGNTALIGSTVDAGESISLDTAGDLQISAAVNDNFDQLTKTKKGSFTQSSQNKGSKTQEAVVSSLNAGGNLTINSGGNVTVKGSDLIAQETMTIGGETIAKAEDGSAELSEDGQFVSEQGEQVGNVTVTTQELNNETWNEKSSGFSGILKDLASGVSLVVSTVAATAGVPVDAEIEVGRSSSERSQETIQQASNLQANNLDVDVDGDVAIIGSNATVENAASIQAKSFTLDAAKEQSTYSKTESTTTVSSSAPSVGENEITVANLNETKTSTTETTTSTTWSGSSLNAGSLSIKTDKEVNIVSSDVTVQGDTDIQAQDIIIGGRQDTTETTTTLKEEIKTVSIGVKNAYVDTVQSIEALNSAKNAVRDAKQAYDDAKQKIANGQMPASELKYFETNIAAATANLTNATIAVATAGATAAGTTGTGGFYATGNASVENNESSTTDTSSTWNGSNLNLGGNATLKAQDEIQIKGSNVAVAGGLQMDAEDINLLAGENSTQTSSDSSSHTESASYSTNGGPSGSLSANKTESSSESQYYTNTQIVAGTLSSDSENLTLSGANVDAGEVDITTENLLVESLQNTASSNSQTQGADLSLGGVAPPTSGGINQQQSESSSAWVDQQSGITGGNVSIKAKDTTLKGGLIAAVDENGNDNGQLTLQTDTLTVENIQDHDTSSDKGFSLNTGASTTTVGANYSGHDKRQTTKATIGNGNVQVGSNALADTDIDVNRDVDNAQEITKDHELGGLDATVTVDHRLASEEGRQDIANDFEDTAEHGQDLARATSKLIEDDNLNVLNFGETLHNNAQATQLKNDLVRNPENAELLAGLKSDDPDVYAQAVKDLGQLAQAKFGLDLSEVDLYDGEKTTSGSLGDNALTDVKGGTVVDVNNQNAGDIFIDAGDGASKTDMANTLGHEVLESQDFQGKDSSLTGGLFGTNTDAQQESLANAFGEQFSDRINQAAGGNLDSTGGADFSSNLKNSQAVKAGTQKANTVGNARVDHRQLYVSEAKAIIDHSQSYANKHNISLDQAKQELTQQALLQVDSEWADQAHIQENDRAREALTEIAAKQTDKASDTLTRDPMNQIVRQNESDYFEANEEDYNDTTKNAHEARATENGAAGERDFLTKYATETGEKPLEIGIGDAVGQIADNTVEGTKNLAERITEDPIGLLKDTASGVADIVTNCATSMDCVLPDQTHGTASDRELVHELLNNNDEAKQAAADSTLDTFSDLAGPAGRAVKGTAGTVAGEAVEQATKKTDVQAEIESLRRIGASRREKSGLPIDGGIPDNGVDISNNNARRLLEARGATKKQQQETVDSFEGKITASQGKKGDKYVITETEVGAGSGRFVTKQSAGSTPKERIEKLALPKTNTAETESVVELGEDQVLLNGRVRGQEDALWAHDNAVGGGEQTVTNGNIKRIDTN